MHIEGTFEVTVQGEPPYDTVDGVALARATVEKRFAGPLQGTSRVHMLGARTPAQSAAYVALERIVGSVEGRTGSFVVTHVGSISPGGQSLAIEIVAGSGTGELSGISGRMSIQIVERQHYYALDYELG